MIVIEGDRVLIGKWTNADNDACEEVTAPAQTARRWDRHNVGYHT